MKIFVKTLTNRKISLTVTENTTVMDIKMSLEETEGLYVNQQRIIFKGDNSQTTKL